MRNCLILGSGRSGTSLAAGVLSGSGYFMGEKLNPANITNPKGQFEDREVNAINEELLGLVTPSRPKGFWGDLWFRSRPTTGQRWLARIPLGTSLHTTPQLEARIASLVRREPFCFKDPRFSYTLPVWRPVVGDAVFVCVFRHPAVTVSSMLKQKRSVPHLQDFSLKAGQAYRVWELMYSHILDIHVPQGGDWLFIHYDQFLDGTAYPRLEAGLGISVDRTFADPALSRSEPFPRVNRRYRALYERLCDIAEYRIPSQT